MMWGSEAQIAFHPAAGVGRDSYWRGLPQGRNLGGDVLRLAQEIRWTDGRARSQLFDGSKIRILTIVDAFSKVSPAIDVRSRYTGADVVRTLERVTADYGLPRSIRVDQGPEFISKDLDLWAYMNGVVLDFSRPGKPTDNAFIESLNGKFRAECLNAHWFLSLDDARRKMEDWRRDYNEQRPHSAIGYKPPIALMNRSAAIGPP